MNKPDSDFDEFFRNEQALCPESILNNDVRNSQSDRRCDNCKWWRERLIALYGECADEKETGVRTDEVIYPQHTWYPTSFSCRYWEAKED